MIDTIPASGIPKGIYPGDSTGVSLLVTVFGETCSGCKISDGQQTKQDQTFRVWPPVATSQVTVMDEGEETPSQFIIVDALGRIVRQQEVLPNVQQFIIPTNDLASGLYIARLIGGNEIEHASFIVQH